MKYFITIIALVMVSSNVVFAQQPKPDLSGSWNLKYADGSTGKFTVAGSKLTFSIPSIGEIQGRVEVRSDYFESILSDRRNGINFIFGYVKNNALEGKLQESKPCSEIKKAFKSGIVESNNSCQVGFSATKK